MDNSSIWYWNGIGMSISYTILKNSGFCQLQKWQKVNSPNIRFQCNLRLNSQHMAVLVTFISTYWGQTKVFLVYSCPRHHTVLVSSFKMFLFFCIILKSYNKFIKLIIRAFFNDLTSNYSETCRARKNLRSESFSTFKNLLCSLPFIFVSDPHRPVLFLILKMKNNLKLSKRFALNDIPSELT